MVSGQAAMRQPLIRRKDGNSGFPVTYFRNTTRLGFYLRTLKLTGPTEPHTADVIRGTGNWHEENS
jgi:hypothetical protein